MRKSSAFTIIELLVVVTIIVVLLALLTPSLDRAIEQAMRMQCASHLHTFGLGVPQYALDNRRQMMSVTMVNGNSPYPNLAWGHNSNGYGQWSAEAMRDYVGGVNMDTFLYDAPWYCPFNTPGPPKHATNQSTGATAWWTTDYSYFGRVDVWNTNGHATLPEQLVGRQLGAGKLLMADALYYWRGGGTDSWWFNHNKNGYSVHSGEWGGPVQSSTAIHNITGGNQLFGDSSVKWKNGEEFDTEAMLAGDQNVGWVTQAGGYNFGGDINFW